MSLKIKFILVLSLVAVISSQLISSLKNPLQINLLDHHGRFELALTSGHNDIFIDSLETGHLYQFRWVSYSSMDVMFFDPKKSATPSAMRVRSKSTHLSIGINSIKPQFGILSISCVSCSPSKVEHRSAGAIQTQGGLSAEQLIKDVFIGGNCFDVENVTFRGSSLMIGTFSNGNSSININEGVVICTGNINSIPGPNGQTGISTDLGLNFQDPDVAEISMATLFDVASIEFDFRPKSDVVTFEYVFASDEYCDYVNSDFNDKFGFFLSGPGISGPFSNGGENIAYVPGTTEFTSINSVNSQSNSTFYVDNVPLGQPQDPGSPFPCTSELASQGLAINEIEYDGFTTILQASSPVIECELYHIKIVIADQSDGIFDSAVFLKKNSFNAGALTDVSVIYSRPGDAFMYEGCADGYIEFFRLDPNTIDQDIEVTFSISPASTATPGLDYVPFTNIIIIPAGELSIQIPIEILNDGIIEGIESIILVLGNSCRCSNEEIELFINDLQPLTLEASNLNFCQTTNINIPIMASGGLEPLTYEWSTGSSASSIIETVSQTDTFYVTVTDDCGNIQDTFSIIEIINENSAFFESGDIEFCPLDIIDSTVTIHYLGTPPFVMQIALDGIPFDTVFVTEDSYLLQITSAGIYSINSIQAQDCQITPSDQLIVRIVELNVTSEITDIACASDQLGTIEINAIGDYPSYTYSFSDGFVTTMNEASFLEGSYSVTVTDQTGCFVVDTFEIQKLSGPEIRLDSIRHISCQNPALGYISIYGAGGSGSYRYTWFDRGISGPLLDSLTPGMYTVEIFDEELLCTDTVSFEVFDLREEVEINLSADTFFCETVSARIYTELSDSIPYSIQWFTGDGQIISNQDSQILNVNVEGVYLVRLENEISGCFAFDTIHVISFLFQPQANTTDDIILGCQQSDVLLDASASLLGPDAEVEWSTTDGDIVGDKNEVITQAYGPGLYILKVTDTMSHCFDLDTIRVSLTQEYPLAHMTQQNLLNCNNAQVLISGEQSSASQSIIYSWSSANLTINQTSNPLIVTVNDTGTLIFHVLDTNNGCEAYDTLRILGDFEPPKVVVSSDDTLTCSTDFLILNGIGSSVGDEYIYLWYTADGIISVAFDQISTQVSAPGTYFLMVTDTSNGCFNVDSVLISPDDDLPFIDILPADSLTCRILQVQIDASNSDSGTEYSYLWSTPDGNIDGRSDSLILTVISPGTYILEITNEINGCKNQKSISVHQNVTMPNIELSTTEVINCLNDHVQIITSGSSLGSEYEYFWSSSDGIILSDENDLTASVASAGNYSLQITNTESGCMVIDSIRVEENFYVPNITSDSLFELNCRVREISIQATLADTNAVRYDWLLPDGSIIPDGPSQLNFNQPGLVNLILTSRESGCERSQNFLILENIVSPTLSIRGNELVDCGPIENSLEAIFNMSSAFQFRWSTIDGFILSDPQNSIITISSTGTYSAELINLENGCASIEEISIENNGLITTLLDIDQPNCNATEGIISINSQSSGTPPYRYMINDQSMATSWPITLPAGSYNIYIEDAEGCADHQQVIINDPRVLTLQIAEIGVLKFGDSVMLQPEFNIELDEIQYFEWRPVNYLNDPEFLFPISTPLDDISYELIIRDSAGCEVSAFVSLELDRLINYFVPNVFSPNGDGINDRISIFTNENINQIKSFQIFNRWGDRVFENFDFPPNDLNFGWDGRFKNKPLDPAVFVYQAELQTVFGTSILITGDITLAQ
jgi:gliding motility-associated-like protein